MDPPKIWREKRERYLAAGIKCISCKSKNFPKTQYCPSCGSKEVEEYKLATTGKIMYYTTVTQTMVEMSDNLPYVIGIIELDDGVKVTGQITDSTYDNLKEGMKVRMVLRVLARDNNEGLIRYGFKFVPI